MIVRTRNGMVVDTCEPIDVSQILPADIFWQMSLIQMFHGTTAFHFSEAQFAFEIAERLYATGKVDAIRSIQLSLFRAGVAYGFDTDEPQSAVIRSAIGCDIVITPEEAIMMSRVYDDIYDTLVTNRDQPNLTISQMNPLVAMHQAKKMYIRMLDEITKRQQPQPPA